MAYLDNFNYEIRGLESGPKMVFLHGLLGSGANWRKVATYFEGKYQILLFDQRGHGRSFQPSSGYAPKDYASDLHQILAELGWDKIYLVGHSMGGRNGLWFCHENPGRVIKFVLEDIGPEKNWEAAHRIQRLLDLVPTPFSSRAEAKKFLLEKFPQMIPQHPHPLTLAQYFYSNITEVSGRVDWRFSREGVLASLREGRDRDYWREWEGLQVPTLLIRGAESDELSREVYLNMLNRQPLARGIEIPDSGHWVHFDQVESFVAALQDFFAS